MPYRLVYSPIGLPPDFPVVGGGADFEQGDAPITFLHSHECIEFGYCYKGDGIFVIGSKVLPFHAGDVSVITPAEVHLARSAPGTRSHWAWVYVDPIRLLQLVGKEADCLAMDRLSGRKFNNLISPAGDPLLGALLPEIVEELRHRRPGYQATVKGMIWSLMARLQRLAPKRGSSSGPMGSEPAMRRIAPALDLMMEAYGRRTSVTEWARRCHCSVTNFRRLFHKALGKSPHEYLTELRIRMATTRLHSTRDKIVDVAMDVGFASLSSFNRSFRTVMGCSPREWRKRQ